MELNYKGDIANTTGNKFVVRKKGTPILNKGIELITQSISALKAYKNKNERQSYDDLPFSTRGGT